MIELPGVYYSNSPEGRLDDSPLTHNETLGEYFHSTSGLVNLKVIGHINLEGLICSASSKGRKRMVIFTLFKYYIQRKYAEVMLTIPESYERDPGQTPQYTHETLYQSHLITNSHI